MIRERYEILSVPGAYAAALVSVPPGGTLSAAR